MPRMERTGSGNGTPRSFETLGPTGPRPAGDAGLSGFHGPLDAIGGQKLKLDRLSLVQSTQAWPVMTWPLSVTFS